MNLNYQESQGLCSLLISGFHMYWCSSIDHNNKKRYLPAYFNVYIFSVDKNSDYLI